MYVTAEDVTGRPLCQCHGEAKQRNGHDSYGNQKWRCAVRSNERMRGWYDALTGLAYNRLLLTRRRTKALRRMKLRTEVRHRTLPREG